MFIIDRLVKIPLNLFVVVQRRFDRRETDLSAAGILTLSFAMYQQRSTMRDF